MEKVPMGKSVGIRDVASAAGVAVGTVSNVINRPDLVADDTRRRVETTMKELGFVRNDAARSLRAGSRTIAMLITDIDNPFFVDLSRGVQLVADANEAIVAMFSSDGDLRREQRYLSILEQQRVIGILFDGSLDDVSGVVERGTPLVLLDRPSDGGSECSVAVDDVAGGRLVADHLVAEGHTRVAFVGPMGLRPIASRHLGFQQGLEDAGVAPAQVLNTKSLTIDDGRHAATRLLSLNPDDRPSAIFCANDLVALGAMQAALDGGLRVPGDLAIVGYDDIDLATTASVPLTTIRQPRFELGRVAATLLLDEVGNADHSHRDVILEAELVVRESSITTNRQAVAG
jgi:LacI family transcriptional regulator